jgi:hypothetical protein
VQVTLPSGEFNLTDIHETSGLHAPRLRAEFIYIDASVYRALQFDWDGRWLSALADLVRRGLIRVVITDITKREVQSLIREFWFEANKSIQKSATALRQLGLADTVDALANEQASVATMVDAFERWLERVNVFVCKNSPDIGAILEDYFAGSPPFGTGHKKAEFPDGIVASMLRAWCATTGLSTYVVSHDGDLKACCSADGPLVFAASIGEVISHGIASAALHDAITVAVRESEYFTGIVSSQICDLSVTVETGYRNGARINVEVETVTSDEVVIDEVIVEGFDGTSMTCYVYFSANLFLQAQVEQEPVQYSDNEWDSGYQHRQTVSVWQTLSATVTASPVSDDEVDLEDVYLHERRLEIPWRDVAREIE